MARGTVKRLTTPKRKRIVWEARLDVTDRDGARHQMRRRFGTKKEAERWLSEKESAVWVDGIGVTPTMTVAEYAALWMERKQREWSESTAYNRRSGWRSQIGPALGHVRLAELTKRDCQRFIDRLARTHSPNYVRSLATQLTALLNGAVRDELIPRNPARSLTLPRPVRSTPTTWTATQAKQFLRETPPGNVHTLAAIMLYTGLRIGEALALRWQVVDLAGGRLAIVATMSIALSGDVVVRDATKTAASRRTVPITDALATILRDHQARQAAWIDRTGIPNPDGLVFLDRRGNRWHPSTARLALREAIKRTDLPKIPPHAMRHGAATVLLGAGIPTKIVAELLGHASVAITSDLYQHSDVGMRSAATDRLGALLGEEG